MPDSIYDYGAEIVRNIGVLGSGSRIVVLLAEGSHSISIPFKGWRPPVDGGQWALEDAVPGFWLRLDDNDPPGQRNCLSFVPLRQTMAEVRRLLERADVVEINVNAMSDWGVVVGGIGIIVEKGAWKADENDGKNVRFHKELCALVTVVEDAAGEPVWTHAVCLDAQGHKVSATEKRRRLDGAGMPNHGFHAAVKPASKFRLAEALARMLADPTKLKIPVELATALATHWSGQWTPSRKLFGAQCARLAMDLAEARKIVCDEAFSKLIIDTAEQSPEAIEWVFATARPPFELCWLEWDRSSSADWADAEDRYWGCLIAETAPGNGQFNVVVAEWIDGQAVLLPGSLLIDFREELEWPIPERVLPVWSSAEDSYPMIAGMDYYERWPQPRHRRALARLGRHGATIMGPPPWSALQVLAQDFGNRRELLEPMQLAAALIGGVFREVVCALALMATHRGGGAPLMRERIVKGSSRFYGGKIRAGFEYQIVELVRPMTAPRLMRRLARARAAAAAVKFHPVVGAWHHRRTPVADCRTHPSVCILAQWQNSAGEIVDDAPVSGDVQACVRCARHRWWVKGHDRGDPELGMIGKDYEVVMRRRRRRGHSSAESSLPRA